MTEPPPPLVEYVTRVSPEYAPPYHLADLGEQFERARRSLMGESDDVVRTLAAYPIRHYKTETLLHGVLWLLEWIPSARFVLMTYSLSRAQWLGKRLRALAERTKVGPTRGWNTIEYWQNDQNGGVAVMSADQSKEGYDCHGLFCDDPIDENGVESPEQRETVDRTIAYYTARCMRRNRPGPVIVSMSRFHPDDPFGRRETRGWTILCHPAIIDLGLETERAFAPDVWSLDQLKRVREEERERDPAELVFWARLQQSPRSLDGNTFGDPALYDAEAFPTWPGFRDFVGLDMSYSTTRAADWSAVVALRVYEGRGFIRHAERFKLDPDLVRHHLRSTLDLFGHAPIFSYVSGPEVGIIKDLLRHGLRVHGLPARYNKLVRAQRTRVAWNEGRLMVPDRSPWGARFIKVVKDFRGVEGDDDDEVDALVSACDGGMFRSATVPHTLGRPRTG